MDKNIHLQLIDEAIEVHRADVICSKLMLQNRGASFHTCSHILLEPLSSVRVEPQSWDPAPERVALGETAAKIGIRVSEVAVLEASGALSGETHTHGVPVTMSGKCAPIRVPCSLAHLAWQK